MLVAGKYFSTSQDLQEKVTQLLHELPVNQAVSADMASFLMAVLKLHPDFDTQYAHLNIEQIYVHEGDRSSAYQRFFMIKAGHKEVKMNISQCINGKRNASKIKKILRVYAKQMMNKMLEDFQQSDRICNITWKPIPVGQEVIAFKHKTQPNITLEEIAEQFLPTLSQREKESTLHKKEIPVAVAYKWEMFFKSFNPAVAMAV